MALTIMTVVGGTCIAWETPGPNDSKEINYCHDPAAEDEWMDLLAKNPNDFKFRHGKDRCGGSGGVGVGGTVNLYVLRISTCSDHRHKKLSEGVGSTLWQT